MQDRQVYVKSYAEPTPRFVWDLTSDDKAVVEPGGACG
jgi:hypothetical protein